MTNHDQLPVGQVDPAAPTFAYTDTVPSTIGATGERGPKGEPGASSEPEIAALATAMERLTIAMESLADSNRSISTVFTETQRTNAKRGRSMLVMSAISVIVGLVVLGGVYEIHQTQKSNASLLQLVKNVTNPNSSYSKQNAAEVQTFLTDLETCVRNEEVAAVKAEEAGDPVPTNIAACFAGS